MSKPLGHNGAGWVDAQFWRGDAWVGWNPDIVVPPQYAQVGNWDFAGSVQGWYNTTFNNNASEPYVNGPYCRQDQLEAGLFGSMEMGSPYNSSVPLPVGTAYRLRAAVGITRRSGNEPPTKNLNMSVADASLALSLPEGNSGFAEYATPFAYTQYEYTSFQAKIGVSAGALNANSLYTMDVDWARIEDGNGNPLIYVSVPGSTTPGYQPKVFNGWEWV